MPSTKILVVDDEPDLVSLLQEWLEEEGHEVLSATNAEDGLKLFFEYRPSLSITDLRMPGMDGFQFISRIRELSDGHLLVFTALGSDEHTIRGFDLGADDYLVKPVSKRVFLARVRSLLRRALPPEQTPASVYSDICVTLNFLTHEVQVRGDLVYLRPTEFRLLSFLARNSDRVVGHQELLERVWGDPAGSLDSLKWYVSALRNKVEEEPQNPALIITVPRIGYRYSRPEDRPTSGLQEERQ